MSNEIKKVVSTAEELQNYIDTNISYKSFGFTVIGRGVKNEFCDLHILHKCICNDTGKPITIKSHAVIKLEQSIFKTIDQIWKKIVAIETHEASEKFKVRNFPIYKDHMRYIHQERATDKNIIENNWLMVDYSNVKVEPTVEH